MKCEKCNTPTYVRDTARSSGSFISNKGHEYLERWGMKHAIAVGLRDGQPFTARIHECPNCGTRYRTIEYALEELAPRKNTKRYGRAGKG